MLATNCELLRYPLPSARLAKRYYELKSVYVQESNKIITESDSVNILRGILTGYLPDYTIHLLVVAPSGC